MSDDNNSKPRFVKVHLTECERNPEHMHVTGIEPITDVDVVYDAPDADRVLASSTFGWSGSRTWDKNWEGTFGTKQPEPELN